MNRYCEVCGMGDMVVGDNATLYCQNCGAQSTQYIEEAFDGDDAHIYTTAYIREKRVDRNVEFQNPDSAPLTREGVTPDGRQDLEDGIRLTPGMHDGSAFFVKSEGLSQPGSQFGQQHFPFKNMSDDELASEIRKGYVYGVQRILQLQCESLVKEFGVTPLICGIVGPIWLKFVASTRVFEEVWSKEAILVAEHREQMRRESQPNVFPAVAQSQEDETANKQRKRKEKKQQTRTGVPGPRTSYGRKCAYVWLTALKERIPLSISLALCYLSCYIAREPILPTDITKWASNGRLPYLAVFMEISKPASYQTPNIVGGRQLYPLKPRLMFQPLNMVGARRVELEAGFVAQRVGVQLPPVNFHAICARFLRDMGLPVKQLLTYASRLYEWYTPSGLSLSAQEAALPTRVYVMAMLIIAIKILYPLDGRPIQQVGETPMKSTLRDKQRRTEKRNNGLMEPFHRMATRARPKGKATGEASEDREQKPCQAQNMNGRQADVINASQSAPERQTLGKRKRSSEEKNEGGCGNKCIIEDISGAGSDSNIMNKTSRFQAVRTELDTTKDLLQKLKSAETTNIIDYDEKLSTYLKYCRNVVFSGYDPDVGVEPILERFWGIYEKNMTQVTNQNADNLDHKAAAGTSEKGAVGLNAPAGSILDNEADGKHPSGDNVRNKNQHQPGTHRDQERAGDIPMDVQSEGSLWTVRGSRAEVSMHKKMQKSKEEDFYAENTAVRGVQECEPAPAEEVDRESMKKQRASNLISDMKSAGFYCLPHLTHPVELDEYVRYNFQVSDNGMIPVHGDYFTVLQACGKVIKVHEKALHRCVQVIEKGLLQVESNVENFLLGEKGVHVVELAKAVKRRKPVRRRDRNVEAKNGKSAAKLIEHVTDLSYI